MPHFEHDGHRIAYTEYGEGPRPVVLLHGLLFSQKLVRPLAIELARRGHRAITMDLLGHGLSDRPTAMQEHSMSAYGGQVIGLLDHLGIEEAVIHGLSLGANTALEAVVQQPARVRGLVVEMPVLDNALLGCAIAFTPVMCGLTFGEPLMRVVQRIAKLVPSGPFWFGDVLLDLVRQDPKPSAAVMQGLFFHQVAPPKAVRRTIKAPTLVIGHDRDPVHPFGDSDALVEELEHARLLRASSIVELRLQPERLTEEIAAFLDEVWAPAPARRRRSRAKQAA